MTRVSEKASVVIVLIACLILWIISINSGVADINLNPIANVGVGEPLMISGETYREDGTIIVVEVIGPVHLTPHIVKAEQGTFNAVFDTTGACVGVYTVRADDGERGIAEAEVEIGFAVPGATRAFEVSINDELLTTPIPLDGSTTVSVTVTTNGKPVEGAHVDLSTDGTDKRGFTSYGGDTTDRNGIFVAQWKPSDISQKNVKVEITAEASKTGYDGGSATATVIVNPTEEPYITETSAKTFYKQGDPITLTVKVKVKKGGKCVTGLRARAFSVWEGCSAITHGGLGEYNDFKELGAGKYEIIINEHNSIETRWPLAEGEHKLHVDIDGGEYPCGGKDIHHGVSIDIEAAPPDPAESSGPLKVYIDLPSHVEPGSEFEMKVRIVNPTDNTYVFFEDYEIIAKPEGFVINPGQSYFFRLYMELPEALADVVGSGASVVPAAVRGGSTIYFIKYLESQGFTHGMAMPPNSEFYSYLYASAPEKTGDYSMTARLEYQYLTYHGTGLQRWFESAYNTLRNENPDKGEAYSEEKRIRVGEEEGIPGFEAVFAIVGLLAVAYILRRKRM